MKDPAKLKKLATDVWTMSFPLTMLGVDIQRNVTVLRLSSGKLVVHSTAPFGSLDVAEIRKLGEPRWLVDALLRHDTFAKQGTEAFPQAIYLGPPGFEPGEGIAVASLVPPPPEWAGEIDVLAIEGAPGFGEIVMLHRASKTLVVGDLVVNFPGGGGFWSGLLFKLGAVGGKCDPGVTRPFKNAIEDEAAFVKSLETVLGWDFERIVVGHGEPILSAAKSKLRAAYEAAGILKR